MLDRVLNVFLSNGLNLRMCNAAMSKLCRGRPEAFKSSFKIPQNSSLRPNFSAITHIYKKMWELKFFRDFCWHFDKILSKYHFISFFTDF